MTTPTLAQVEAALKAYNASTKSSYPENAMRAALTAAVEVGEPAMRPGWATEAWLRAELAATIERCAQVAENNCGLLNGDEIAAAIRSLKDKPT